MRAVMVLGLVLCSVLLAWAGAHGQPPVGLPRPAPEFPRSDQDGWINSAPLAMAGLRGRVVVLDVWTFG